MNILMGVLMSLSAKIAHIRVLVQCYYDKHWCQHLNYRLMANERLMYNRLITFLNKHDILSPNQYGFRKIFQQYLLF